MLSKPYQLLVISLIGWPLILIGSTFLGLTWAEYDAFDHTVSVLAAVIAPTRVAMSIIFVIDGILLAVYGKMLNGVLARNFKQIGTGHVLILSGILLALLAFFPGGQNLGIEVATQTAHTTIAALLVVSFIIAPFVFILRMKNYSEWKTTLIVILIITVLKIINYLGSILVVFSSRQISEFSGLLQKLGLALDGTWMIFLSLQLIRLKLPFHRNILF